MSTREDVSKILISTVTVSSNLLPISPLGIPFLSRRPYTDSQTAEPSMSLRVEAIHEPSVSWKTVTRGDRILSAHDKPQNQTEYICCNLTSNVQLSSFHAIGADSVTTKIERVRLQRVYRLS